jgi:hypothetical protein
VPHAGHQVLNPGPARSGEGVPGMAQIMVVPTSAQLRLCRLLRYADPG